MYRDPRYLMVKELVESRIISSYAAIYNSFPKSLVSEYLGTNNNRMSRLIHNPKQMTLEELERIAMYFDVAPGDLIALIYQK